MNKPLIQFTGHTRSLLPFTTQKTSAVQTKVISTLVVHFPHPLIPLPFVEFVSCVLVAINLHVSVGQNEFQDIFTTLRLSVIQIYFTTVDKPWFCQPWVSTLSISWPVSMDNCTCCAGSTQTDPSNIGLSFSFSCECVSCVWK